jgi:hypothetical protein
MNDIDHCSYKSEYYDFQSYKTKTFPCDQEPLENKDVCLFHNKSYLKDRNHPENKNKVIERLQKRIENSKKNKMPLKCIGYYLPDIELNKEEFFQPVYFNNCKFQKASFSGATFSSKASSPALHSHQKQKSLRPHSHQKQTSLKLHSHQKQTSQKLYSMM